MAPAVVVNGLAKWYGDVKAVNGMSFEVPQGRIFGMLGPNGAGKSTTIELLVGLRRRDAGEVKVLGYDPQHGQIEFKSRIGVQLQSPALYPKLTVLEVVKLFASLFPKKLDAMTVIEKVGLLEKVKAKVESLSGGQKHRLAIAIAMVNDGDLIFLDEPTTGLDPQARRNLWDVIKELQASGKTIFLSTHFMDEAERLCDSLVIVDQGVVIAEGTPTELIDSNFQEKAIEFPETKALTKESMMALPGAKRIEVDDGRNTLFTDDVAQTIAGLMQIAQAHQFKISDMHIRQASLEDVFLKLTGRRIRE